jgi:hypothetical protein
LIVTMLSVCLLLSGCIQTLNVGSMLLLNAVQSKNPKSENKSQGAIDEVPPNKSANDVEVVKDVVDPKAEGKRAQNF